MTKFKVSFLWRLGSPAKEIGTVTVNDAGTIVETSDSLAEMVGESAAIRQNSSTMLWEKIDE